MEDRSQKPNLWAGTPTMALIAAIALVLAGVGMTLYLERSFEGQKIDETRVQAQILASTVEAALFFDDRKAAQDYVNAVKANPEIETAAVYDANGALFVSFSRSGEQPPPIVPTIGGARLEDSRVMVVSLIMQGTSPVGAIYLRSILDPIGSRLMRYGLVGLLVTMASLTVAILGRSQKALAGANFELESRASDLTVVNESLQTQIEKREKVEEALRQAQKMEAIGQLTGGVAHDFNNLLTVVIGNLELIRSDPANAKRTMRLADGASLAAERGARLVKQLLMFARRQPMRPEILDPNRAIAEFEPLMKRLVSANIDVVLTLARDLDLTRVDSAQFQSAMLNLVANASEAITGPGRISIESRNVELTTDDTAANPDITPGGYVMVAVSDTGRGIRPDLLPRVFDPFVTTKEVGKGSGLGLSQVYGFAKESGGHVEILSEIDLGTTVTLYLPRSTDQAVAAEPERAQEQRLSGSPVNEKPGNETILVVEDEPNVLDMAVESLKQLGYRVLSAENAFGALEILKGDEVVDILFSDVVMPGVMNGAQLAVAARQIRPAMKVLLTSGYTASALAAEHSFKDDVPLLPKPYRAQELATHLRLVAGGA